MLPKKILIIHLSRLGDMLQSLPAVKLLKEDYPESELTYLGIDDFCIPLQDIPWIDNLVAISLNDIRGISTEDARIDTEKFDRLFQLVPELGANYDLLINMTHSRGSSYLSSKIAAKEKRGRLFSEASEIVMAGNWGKYLWAVARNRKDNLLNLVDIYIGMAGIQHRPVKGYLPTNPETDRRCLLQLTQQGFNPERLAVGFQLGASKSLRTWPAACFFRLGELLSDQLDAQIVLFGTEQERVLANQFHESSSFKFIDLIGKTTLADLPSFMKHIHVLVSNDTGPMHIAAAVGTKIVGIFMATAHFKITGPYGAGHIALQSNYPCSPCLDSSACSQPVCGKNISPETVMHGVESVLELESGSMGEIAGTSLYRSDFDENGTLFCERLDNQKDHFLSRLISFRDSKACISQTLWNQWLGLKPSFSAIKSAGDDDEIVELLTDYKNACLSYGKLNRRGEKACKNIISEFGKPKPNLELIQDLVTHIEKVEQEIKTLESPLAILKEIHELYCAEIEYCNFPQLAYEFLNKYKKLSEIIDCFESSLNQMHAVLLEELTPSTQNDRAANSIAESF